jgi:hypothetical protein
VSTIDIEDLVQAAKNGSVKAATAWLIGKIALVFPFVLSPWFNWIAEGIIKYGAGELWELGELGLFQVNAEHLAGVQAATYREKLYKIKTLPDDVSDEEWINAEKEADTAFIELINARK